MFGNYEDCSDLGDHCVLSKTSTASTRRWSASPVCRPSLAKYRLPCWVVLWRCARSRDPFVPTLSKQNSCPLRTHYSTQRPAAYIHMLSMWCAVELGEMLGDDPAWECCRGSISDGSSLIDKLDMLNFVLSQAAHATSDRRINPISGPICITRAACL